MATSSKLSVSEIRYKWAKSLEKPLVSLFNSYGYEAYEVDVSTVTDMLEYIEAIQFKTSEPPNFGRFGVKGMCTVTIKRRSDGATDLLIKDWHSQFLIMDLDEIVNHLDKLGVKRNQTKSIV